MAILALPQGPFCKVLMGLVLLPEIPALVVPLRPQAGGGIGAQSSASWEYPQKGGVKVEMFKVIFQVKVKSLVSGPAASASPGRL